MRGGVLVLSLHEEQTKKNLHTSAHTASAILLQGLTSRYPSTHWLHGWHFAHLPSLYVLFLHGVVGNSWFPPSSSKPQFGVTSRPGVTSPNITHIHIASPENITRQYIPSLNGHGTHVELLLSQRVVRSLHLSEYLISGPLPRTGVQHCDTCKTLTWAERLLFPRATFFFFQ